MRFPSHSWNEWTLFFSTHFCEKNTYQKGPSLHPQVVSWSHCEPEFYSYIVYHKISKNRIVSCLHVMSSCHLILVAWFFQVQPLQTIWTYKFQAWMGKMLKMLPRLCPFVPNPPSLWLPTLGQSIHDVETGSLIWKKKSHTQKSQTMKVQPVLLICLIFQSKKSTNHLNPIQNTGIVLWKKRVQQIRTHSFSGQGRFSKRSPASSSSFLAKQSWYLRLKKWALNSIYGTSGQGLL